ncbi:MAG: class I SAM-dependent methyltransferase [Armatimonadota bacterium]|nr:MAG: class I SAM-dependent methyltransferase [Armatimonadota bacterium]
MVEHLSVYNMSATGCLAEIWGQRSQITYSEYFDGCESGEYRDGVLCQNVEGLSFADESFDLVISEDVFEHVRDYHRGLAEIRRVLKPGGYHIFSVPLGFTHPTLARFAIKGGQEVPVLPVEHHGDPVRGQIRVFTSFGYDLFDQLSAMGFEVSLEISRYDDERRYGTFHSCTFVTRKQ